MRRLVVGILAIGVFSMILSCGSKSAGTGTSNESFGHLSMALNACTAPLYDVAGVQVKLFKDTAKECTDVADFEKTTALICVPDHTADALFVLAAGDYKVCAIPVKNTDQPPYVPSDVCSPVYLSPVTVIPEVVKEITLTSLCSNPNGGLDVITKFKDLVLITGLTIEPDKFITTCDKATITITVDDPTVVNTYVWTITLLPPGSTKATLTQPDPTKPWIAVLTPDVAGDYEVQVDVTNPAGNKTSLKKIPIHVRECCDPVCASGQICCTGVCKTATTCEGCGDGVVTPPETCDTAIAVGQPGACPTSCSPGDDACNPVTLQGTLCKAACVATPVTVAVCGDGCVTSPEKCDSGIAAGNAGACPTTCDDGLACTKDVSTGSAATCDLVCTHTPITECGPNEGCCNRALCSGVQGASNFDPNCVD